MFCYKDQWDPGCTTNRQYLYDRLDVSYQVCLWDRSQVPIVWWNTRETGNIYLTSFCSGPVQFERDEEDPFGLDQFLDTAKRASGANKRGNDDDR